MSDLIKLMGIVLGVLLSGMGVHFLIGGIVVLFKIWNS